jgi:hypothetical protein
MNLGIFVSSWWTLLPNRVDLWAESSRKRREDLFKAATKESLMDRYSRAATLACLAAMAVALTPIAAVAQMRTYYHVGAWDAFSGRSDSGGAVCGVGTTNRTEQRSLSIRFDIGGSETMFAASKPDWSIPQDTRVTVVMQIGLDTPWTQQASGNGHSINWALDRNAMQVFDRQFRGAASMTVTFPEGNEPPWTLSLAGSTAISDTFARCVRDLTRQVRATQPRADDAPPQGPTQPFSPPAVAAPALPPR